MKLTIVSGILLFGIAWGFVLIYQLLQYRYGQKIRDHIELKEARRIIQEARDKKALKYKRDNEVQEVDIEEVLPCDAPRAWTWDVNYEKRQGETIKLTHLINE